MNWGNFSREEFACKCGCGFDAVDHELLEVLQSIRDYFGQPVKINSGCRCAKHNAAVGGMPGSKHVLGKAADIVVEDVHPEDVYSYIVSEYSGYGVGLYSSWVHVDVRNDKARW